MKVTLSEVDYKVALLPTPAACENRLENAKFSLSLFEQTRIDSSIDENKAQKLVDSRSRRIVEYQARIAEYDLTLGIAEVGSEKYLRTQAMKKSAEAQLDLLTIISEKGADVEHTVEEHIEVLKAELLTVLITEYVAELEARKAELEAA
jgi:hypothetical protein